MNRMSAKDTLYADGRFSPEIVDQVIRFSRNPNFRSATAAELITEDTFFRRPVRPEDLHIIDFSQPLNRAQALDLGGLIGNRVLLNCFEGSVHAPPTSTQARHLESYQAFYDPASIQLGQLVQPFLEWYLFDMLHDREATDEDCSIQRVGQLIHTTWQQLCTRQEKLAAAITRSETRSQDEAFILIQHAALLSAKQAAAARAHAAGMLLPSWRRNHLTIPVEPALESALREAARTRELELIPHRYWQFYLSSAMGCCNLLYSLCSSAGHNLRAWAAILFCRLHLAAFQAAFRNSLLAAEDQLVPLKLDNIVSTLTNELEAASEIYGPQVCREFAIGFRMAARQWQLLDDDMAQQINWLGSIDEHKAMAAKVMQMVERNKDSILLDTFTETLRTCSTTHVHNEHRLVVIETGQMVFWGNLDMQLHLSPGEMILVPRNRLHGSSITTDMCVYHQPIIPASWLENNTTG